jgi:hypothetical protein
LISFVWPEGKTEYLFMKISEAIEGLSAILREHGDGDVICCPGEGFGVTSPIDKVMRFVGPWEEDRESDHGAVFIGRYFVFKPNSKDPRQA